MYDFYDDSLGYIQYTIQKFYKMAVARKIKCYSDIKFHMVDPL